MAEGRFGRTASSDPYLVSLKPMGEMEKMEVRIRRVDRFCFGGVRHRAYRTLEGEAQQGALLWS